jgi:RNA polymerase sigma-70 factor (ECF subfamily)
MDKAVLVEQCKRGDSEAYSRLYELYASKALRTAYLMVGSKALAEDIVQEAFIQCFQRIRSLKKPEAFEAWFYQILTRLSFRMGYKESRKLSAGIYEDEIDELKAPVSGEPLQALECSETRNEVKRALESLSPNIRTVIVLFYFNEMSIKQIAEVLSCFEGTVKSRLHNGRKQLKLLLDSDINDNQIREECGLNVDARSI